MRIKEKRDRREREREREGGHRGRSIPPLLFRYSERTKTTKFFVQAIHSNSMSDKKSKSSAGRCHETHTCNINSLSLLVTASSFLRDMFALL